MFDDPYKVRYATRTDNIIKGQFMIRIHKLTFSCVQGNKYIVDVEEYVHHVYAIKFFLKANQHSSKRFSLLTNTYGASRIFATCVMIMKDFLEKDDLASFGFIGANSLDEGKDNTKRFRIYKYIMEAFFSPTKFKHLTFSPTSAYFMFSNKCLLYVQYKTRHGYSGLYCQDV